MKMAAPTKRKLEDSKDDQNARSKKNNSSILRVFLESFMALQATPKTFCDIKPL